MLSIIRLTILSLLFSGVYQPVSASNNNNDIVEEKNTRRPNLPLEPNDSPSAIPTGSVISFAGTTAPQGWLLCDGQGYSDADYPELYNVIGMTYVPQDSHLHRFNQVARREKFFCVPDLRGRTTIGVDNGASRVTANNTLGASGNVALDVSSGTSYDNYVKDYFDSIIIPTCKRVIKNYGGHLEYPEWNNFNALKIHSYFKDYFNRNKTLDPKSFLEMTSLGKQNSSYVQEALLEISKIRLWNPTANLQTYLVLNYIIRAEENINSLNGQKQIQTDIINLKKVNKELKLQLQLQQSIQRDLEQKVDRLLAVDADKNHTKTTPIWK